MGRYLVVFLIIIIASFLESTIFPFNLVFLIIISLAVFGEPQLLFLISFFSGIGLDILKGNPLGQSSLLFLLATATVYLYKKKFKLKNLRFFLPFSFLIVTAVNYYFKQPLILKKTFFETLLLIIIIPLTKSVFQKKSLRV